MPFEPSVKARRRAGPALVGIGATLLFWGCGFDPDPEPAAPGSGPIQEDVGADMSRSLEATSELGRYRIATRPAAPPVELHQMHDWIVRIELLEESSAIPTSIRFDGGMPSHGHGFSTQPRVTQNLGNGEFRVEGVKFHMAGPWVLRITVTSREGSDYVELPVTIAP
jgi:hypothetical protein